MKKLADLRQHLADTVPSLAKDPDKLHVYIEKGDIACRAGSLSFEYRYEAKIMIADYADTIDTLMVPLLAWIAQHQPDLLLHPDRADNAIRYEAEIVDRGRTDILLTIDGITERVIVQAVTGGYTVTHCDEPALPDMDGPTPWQLFVNGTPFA